MYCDSLISISASRFYVWSSQIHLTSPISLNHLEIFDYFQTRGKLDDYILEGNPDSHSRAVSLVESLDIWSGIAERHASRRGRGALQPCPVAVCAISSRLRESALIWASSQERVAVRIWSFFADIIFIIEILDVPIIDRRSITPPQFAYTLLPTRLRRQALCPLAGLLATSSPESHFWSKSIKL